MCMFVFFSQGYIGGELFVKEHKITLFCQLITNTIPFKPKQNAFVMWQNAIRRNMREANRTYTTIHIIT